MIGKVIGNCKITERIGVGGFGAVYKAIQLSLNREVAIKVLHSQFTEDAGFVERFQSEAKILANLSHHNIVQVHDIVEENKTYFIIMEYVKGETMKDILDRRKRLPIDQAVKVAQDVARALDYTHRKNIIHRDIKPANIILTEDGISKVTDFGIAKVLTEATQSFTRVGTLSYSSPEQIAGETIDARADIYALGITLYHMLTGELPAPTRDAVSPRTIDPSIPAALEKVVMKAIQKKKEDRYATMDIFLKDLELSSRKLAEADKTVVVPEAPEEKTILMEKGKPTSKPSPKLPQKLPQKAKKPVWIYAAGAVAAVIILLAALPMFMRPKEPKEVVKEPGKDDIISDRTVVKTPDTGSVSVERPVVSPRDIKRSEDYYRNGENHINKEEWTDAVKDFEDAIRYNEGNALAHYELGLAYYHLVRTEEAEIHIKKAVELDPQNVLYYRDLGTVYMTNGKKEEAIQVWEKAKKTVDPQNQNPDIEIVLKDIDNFLKIYKK